MTTTLEGHGTMPRTVARAPAGFSPDAARDMAPILVGLMPYALVVGIAMGELGEGTIGSLSTSFLIFGGSAQMAALAVIGSGASLAVAGLTVALVNARLVVYGATLAGRFTGQPTWFRWFGPHFIVDQTWALATARSELVDPARFRRYWLTAGALLTAVWLSGIGAGMALGPIVPADSPLDVTTAALFVALLVPRLVDRVTVTAALVASAVTVAASGLPNGAGVLLGICGGVGVAIAMARATDDEEVTA